MSVTFLRLEASTGNLFESSKEAKEGYKETKTKNPQTGQEVISHRKYFSDGIFGRLSGMHLKETEFEGRKIHQIQVSFVDGEERYSIDITYKDPKGDISSYAESFIAHMPFLAKEEAYRFFPYAIEDKEKKTKSGNPRKTYGFSFKYANLLDKSYDNVNKIGKLQYSSTNKETGEVITKDIPQIDWEENFDGVTTMDKKKRNMYLHGVLKQYSVEYAGGGSANNGTYDRFAQEGQKPQGDAPTTTADPTPPATTASTRYVTAEALPVSPNNIAAEDDDTLPF